MQIADRFIVQATTEKVWRLLWDFPRLAGCLPGCREIVRVDDTVYRAKMKQSVGPFTLDMDMTFKVVEVEEGRRIVFSGSGQDRTGNRMKLDRATLELDPRSDTETEVAFDADMSLYGKMAALGHSMIVRKSRDIGVEFGRRITEELSKEEVSHG